MADANVILNVPDSPPLDHEYKHHIWSTISPNVHIGAIQQLRETTYGEFHDSTYYFAICKGIEHKVIQLAKTAIAQNQCQITYDTDEEDKRKGQLTHGEVLEGITTLLIEQTDSDEDEQTLGNKVSIWMIRWNKLN